MSHKRTLATLAALCASCALALAQYDFAPGEAHGQAKTETRANARSEADAKALADSFWPKSRGAAQVTQTLTHTERDSADNHPYYYVFNRGNDQGFIIISADSRSKKVLAYSDSGSFDVDGAPEQMKAWMRGCKTELGSIDLMPDSLLKMDLGERVLSKGKARESQSFASEVRPLLGSINYSQEFPYNNMCPVFSGKRSVTGCVATGATTIMRYHQYPRRPTGQQHSYQWKGRTISATYNTAYDWGNMLASYKNTRPSTAQQNAIAKLMSDAGVSCDMEYTPTSSGAQAAKMAEQMVRMFGFDPAIVEYRRSWFNQQEFAYYLKRELNAGRPVLMAGWGGGGGHCFVCDGYDTNGLFHINWGWNGKSNGYFALTNLNPYALGTGGGKGGGYSDDVWFWGGIQPPTGKTKRMHFLSQETYSCPLNFNKGQNFTLTSKKINNFARYDNFDGKVGLGLYQNGKLVKIVGSTPMQIKPNYYFYTCKVTGNIPTNTPAGRYQLVIMSCHNSENVWRPVLCGVSNSMDVTISGQKVTMKFITAGHTYDLPETSTKTASQTNGGNTNGGNATKVSPTPQLTKAMSVSADGEGNMTVTASVKSAQAFSGKMGLYLYDDLTAKPELLKSRMVTADAKASKATFCGTTDLAPGTHYAILYYMTPEGKWARTEPKAYSQVEFTIDEPGEEEEEADDGYGNIAPGEDGGKSHYTLADIRAMSDDELRSLLAEIYGDEESQTFSKAAGDDEKYDFSDFLEPVFRKGAPTTPIICTGMRLLTAREVEAQGRKAWSLRQGQSDMAEATLRNNTDDEQTRVISLSLFDAQGQWVADLAEQRVTLAPRQEAQVALPTLLTDMATGPYMARLTEADGDYDTPRPLEPSAQAMMLLQVTR